jgi:3-phenylpropionate/trans-cinnamate dioxygenase ferredoxin reductase subunit
MMPMGGMVIIGAGVCGGRAALALREHGYGGHVALVGKEPHLPYERPPLSKEAITAAEAPFVKTITTAQDLAEYGIDFLAGNHAVAIDRAGKSVRLKDGRLIAYDKLLLATGAVPRRLALAGAGPRIAYLRTFDDALAIRGKLGAGRRVAVIGGGFVGLELAASARKLGTELTVIEAQPRILMRGVPAEIAAVVGALHTGNGVEIACAQGIGAIEADDNSVRVQLVGGRVVEADLVVIGIGVEPATALAENAGLVIGNGIAVDERLRTSDVDIFAAGDCCSFPLSIYGGRRVRLEAWRNAQEQGALAARNMLGAEASHAAVPWFWSDQYDVSLHIAGLPDEGRTAMRHDLADGAFILFHLAADGRLVAASGIGPRNTVARDIRLAEMLIARQVKPDPSELVSPRLNLKKLLAA